MRGLGAAGVLLLTTLLPLHGQQRDLRLLEAVKRRDQKAVEALLRDIRDRADLNAAQPDGATALAWAVYLREQQIANALLDAGAKADTSDEYGETPVTLAAANGDAVLLKRLLAAGASARATRWNGETAVMIAAGAGSLDAVKELVRHGGDVNVVEPRGGQTPLMWAAAEGHQDVVAGLIGLGANVNAASKNGFTPLVFSAVRGDVASLETLLAAHADANITLPSGATPLVVAMQYKQTAAALALLQGGASRDVRSQAGDTPLHLAAQVGDMKLTAALLASGADPNVRTPKSTAPAGARGGGGGRGAPAGEQTPLMVAARNDRADVMRALVAAGANPALKAQDGTTLLMSAAAGARLATFKYAWELDPHVENVTSNGNTIMHVAVGLNNRTQPEVCEVIQFLADHGAKLDELNAAGRTPISVADNLPVDLAVDLLTKLLTERGEVPKIPSRR